MATNIASLIKTVKTIEDEQSRGTQALESAIEAIGQEINVFNSEDVPQKQVPPEDLIKATRPITNATAKAVYASNSHKQADIIAAANIGRKCISDLLVTCKVRLQLQTKLHLFYKIAYYKYRDLRVEHYYILGCGLYLGQIGRT